MKRHALSVLAGVLLWPDPTPQPVIRSIVGDPAKPFAPSYGSGLAISPDGTQVVYRTANDKGLALEVRSLASRALTA